MDYPIQYQGLENKNLAVRVGMVGSPQLVEHGTSLKKESGIYKVRDQLGKERAIRFRTTLVDPLPKVQIDHEIISLATPFSWGEYLTLGGPLGILLVMNGLLGGVVGLLVAYVNSRILRAPQTRGAGFRMSALVSAILVGTFSYYTIISSPKLLLDDTAKKDITQYIDGVQVPFYQNNIPYALKLDLFEGRPAVSQGRYQDVYDIYRKVLAISYDQGSLQGIGIGLSNLSWVFEHMGNSTEALRAGYLMYKVSLGIQDPKELGVAELRLGTLFRNQDRNLAMGWWSKAQKSLKGTPYRQDYIRVLVEMGKDLDWLGQKEDSLQVWEEAWSEARTLSEIPVHKWSKWDTALNYGRGLKRAGECQKAITLINTVLPTFAEAEREHDTYIYLLKDLADCYAQRGESDLAFATYQMAYAVYDRHRSRALGDQARAQLDNDNWGLTNAYINHLISAGHFYEALALLETNKARTLNDIQEDTGQVAVYEKWTTLERKQAQERLDVGSNYHSEIQSFENGKDLEREYRQLLALQGRERRALQVNLQIREVAVSTQMTPLDLRAIQAELPQDVALVATYVSSTHIGTFLLTRKGLEYIPTTLSYAEYRNAVNQLRVALSNPYNDFYVEPAQFLQHHLINPITDRVGRKVTRLIYSPDDWLSLVPLGVFHDGRRFLVEKYAIARIPSLRYFVPERHLKPVILKNGITCVDPNIEGYRLPFAQETSAFLKPLYKGQVKELIGDHCSPRQLEEAINANHAPTFLHIGAHGRFYERDPMKSGVYLSADEGNGEYRMWDARGMGSINLAQMKLITLVSCETGLKDPRHPRDVFGIARAVFFSGGQRVLALLWKVMDRPIAKLEQAFYRSFQAQGIPALALQKAQLAMIHHPKYAHPFYWAGFVLTEGPV